MSRAVRMALWEYKPNMALTSEGLLGMVPCSLMLQLLCTASARDQRRLSIALARVTQRNGYSFIPNGHRI